MNKDTRAAKWIAFGSYPTVMVAAFVLFAILVGAEQRAIVAAYVAVLAAAVLIMLHEAVRPYRILWRPRLAEVRVDLLFIAAVQVALPYLLSITLVTLLATWLRTASWDVVDIWPHRSPAAAQACLMLLLSDFARYLLHRLFHKIPFLWRFHAVHHSPQHLYFLKAGRSHPFNKGLGFLVDTLPFALLKVGEDVFAIYLVFYGVNILYQHSNCEVRFGRLNYIFSGPELHRWHHSAFAKESGTNFGSNLIIWDILFGTRFLPKDRQVDRFGLVN